MRLVVRSAVVALLTLVAAVLLAVSTTMTSVALAATALIMGGTGHPLSVPQDSPAFITDYVNGANSNYISPSGLCTGGSPGCTLLAVVTPEQFRFDTGFADMTFDESVAVGRANLDNCIRGRTCTVTPDPYLATGDQQLTDTSYTVFGYSQSATVATLEKRDLAANPQPGTNVFFILAANPNRPHGGILATFPGLVIPFLGVTFSGPTPTDTTMTTVDAARQYDLVPDSPTNPLNLLADINAGFGFFFLHGNYYGLGAPLLQGQYGDTTYYLFPTPLLPILMPVAQVPFIGTPLAVTLDPFFRVLVETAYNRTINPGQPTPAQFLYFPNPISTAVNLAIAVPTGLDNGASTFTGTRPFGTAIPGPYGVGGPPVDTGCVGPNCAAGPTPLTTSSQLADSQMAASAPSTPDPQPDNVVVPTVGTQQLSDPPALPFNIELTGTPLAPATSNPTTTAPRATVPNLPVVNNLVTSVTSAFNNVGTKKTQPAGVAGVAGNSSAPSGSTG